MGNEASNVPSEPTTPLTPPSEWQSVYSFGSKRRSSVSSTRLPTPVDPPEPDLSDLTEEEIKQIRSVIDRAKEMQHEEHKRIRTLEEDYISHAAVVDKRTPVEDTEVKDVTLCPLCLKNEILIDGIGNRKGQNVCVDCENLTCIECGSFEGSVNSRLQEWVCSVCQKRRKLVFSTGLWHPGTDTSDDIPLARELESRLHELKASTKAIPPLEKAASIDQPDTSTGSKPPLRRQMSLPTKPVQVQTVEQSLVPIKENEKILNTSEGSSAQESPLSDDYGSLQPHHGKSRIRGVLWSVVGSCAMGHGSKSDSEMSDNASDDVDMEDVSMQYTRGDGISPDDVSDDVSMMSIGSSGDDSGRLKRKHRPLSLHIPSSLSATSSDEETSDSNVSTDTESRLAPLARMDEERVALAASAFAEEMGEFKMESSENSWADLLDKSDSDTHDDHKSNLSPIAPRSPSWREGLESPPFSPRRKDSYPGKKRSNSPVSPKENRSHFTYNDLSPSSRQMFSDDSHNDKHLNKSHDSFSNIVHKPFARSPDDSVLSNSGDYVYLEMPQREKHASELDYLDLDGDPKVVSRIPESAACMNLATYAATIASNTANLTQMTVSPTNLQVHPGHDRELTVSPDSQSSGSPVSPGYYDNLSIPEEQKDEEDIELADPSSKPIDYQGTKRQKARPPSTDWSPVIDLSPILDVSPSIEEAEQADMFIKQEEERKRRESQEEDDSEGESKHFFQPVKEEDELNSYYGLKRYDRVEDICKLLDIPDSEFEIPKKENGVVEAIQNNINSIQESNELPFSCASIAPSAETNDKFSVLTVQSNIDSTTSVIPSKSSPKLIPMSLNDDDLSSGVNKENEIVLHQRPKSAGSKGRRKLPEPTPEMIAAHVKKHSSKSLPPPLPPPKLEKANSNDGQKGRDYATIIIPEKKLTSAVSKSVQKHKQKDKQQNDQVSLKDPVQKQDSDERRRKAKDMKAKPNPIVIQHIDSEDQSMSPQYKVLDSPPSPESRSSLKRDYSDSTSVSPSSSPDRDLYAYPSPVTPPDSDSSPPKPHSPSSPGTDFDEDGITINQNMTNVDDGEDQDSCKVEGRVKERIKKYEQATSSDQRKVRRKLPPLPQEEQIVFSSHLQQTKIKPHNVQRKQPLKPDPRRHRAGYTTPSSTSDDSMNEEDKEVAMLTKQRRINDLDKPSLDRWNGNYLPADVSDLKVMKNVKQMYNEDVKANIPPDNNHKMSVADRKLDQFLKDRDETDQIIDSMINIYGVPITQAMKSLKRRLQEELRRVTEGRRRRIEEIEEIRALQRQIGELKLGQEYAKVQAKRNHASPKHAKGSGQNGKKRNSVPLTAPRSSPQVIPRRARHKRQSSDPMVSKFSPIKEDKDTEADFQFKAKAEEEEAMTKYVTDDSSQSGLSDNDSTRSEPTNNTRYKKIKPSAYASMFYNQSAHERRGKSPNLDAGDAAKMQPKSHSESHIPQKVKDKPSSFFSDDDEKKAREQRKLQLQNEIEKRKRQLEETTKLQTELFNLSRPSHIMAHSYDDIPRKSSRTFPSTRPIPTGIIKPLEDEDYDEVSDDREFVTRSYQEISKPIMNSSEASYSSTEYLAHKQESARRSKFDEPTSYSNPYLYTGNINDPRACKPSKQKVDFYLDPSSRDAHITSSVTLPELHTSRADMDFPPNKDHVALSDTETSPPSDSTPAMPLLDDVTARSRKIIHEIGTGSRPVSAEFSFNIMGSEDLLNGMYRVESDNSVDADEPIMKHLMEGGVTILKQLERKKQPPPALPKSYDFPTKRILLTRDPKDRSVKAGNGLGMKIIGGRTIPGTSTVGAYVATIYPGGIADQLHGELREGDQILEWNGIELSNKSFEEVQRVIGQPNGEIELVVRPRNREADDKEKSGSCHSSYDNIDFVADDVYEKCLKSNHGVDPNQLAAQLEGIKETESPAGSQSSSQHEFLTPSVSSPCSSPRSDHASSSSDRQRHGVTMDYVDKADKSTQQETRDWGEIQLQLNHDEYDSSLLIHVAQARNLRPKDINGLSDPFVKIYLLPGRCAENKRRTKHISRTLNPEWHQTVMFSDIHKEEIKYKTLEITVWDYDRFKTNDFLGEVVIDLSVPGFLDDQPHWYPLQEHDQTRGVELPKPTVLPPTLRLEENRRTLGSPSLLKSARDSPNMQRRRGKSSDGMGRRRRSLGTLADVDKV